jgi:hypothetical protein
MTTLWTSAPLVLADGLVVETRASLDGVTTGKQVDGVYASDTLMTPEQAMQHADDLTRAAAIVLQARAAH